MADISCPKCESLGKTGGFHTWQILVSICLFPLGLLSLLAEKEPNKCHACGHAWR